MKLVKENLNEFTRGSDPLETLGIGRVAKIRKWARDLDISDKDYEITPTQVIFMKYLNLRDTNVDRLPNGLKVGGGLWLNGCTGLTSLPDDLEVGRGLYLTGCIGLTSLPGGLQVGGDLDLQGCTGLTRLPDDLIVIYDTWVNRDQKRLLDWLRSSRFKNKLIIQ